MSAAPVRVGLAVPPGDRDGVVSAHPSSVSSWGIIHVWELALVVPRVVLRKLRRDQRAGAVVEQPDRVKSGDAHPGRQRPACRPVTVVVHGQRGVAVACAHVKEANDVGAVAAICAVLPVVVFDPAKYQLEWVVPLGGVLAGGLAESLGHCPRHCSGRAFLARPGSGALGARQDYGDARRPRAIQTRCDGRQVRDQQGPCWQVPIPPKGSERRDHRCQIGLRDEGECREGH
jgi:hypothetical protein